MDDSEIQILFFEKHFILDIKAIFMQLPQTPRVSSQKFSVEICLKVKAASPIYVLKNKRQCF